MTGWLTLRRARMNIICQTGSLMIGMSHKIRALGDRMHSSGCSMFGVAIDIERKLKGLPTEYPETQLCQGNVFDD